MRRTFYFAIDTQRVAMTKEKKTWARDVSKRTLLTQMSIYVKRVFSADGPSKNWQITLERPSLMSVAGNVALLYLAPIFASNSAQCWTFRRTQFPVPSQNLM